MTPRVLFVLEATTGGTHRHLADILTHAHPEAFTPVLAVSQARGDTRFEADCARWRDQGIGVHDIRMTRAIHPPRDVAAVRALRRLAQSEAVHVVHAISSKAGALARLALGRFLPVLYAPHGFAFTMRVPGWKRSLYRAIERGLVTRTHRLLATSDTEAGLARDIGHPPGRVVVVPNGIDPQAWRPAPGAGARLGMTLGLPPDATVIACIGRLCEQKGQRLLLGAMAGLLVQHDSLHLVLAGEGPDREPLDRAVQGMMEKHPALRGRIHLPGHLESGPLLDRADLVVLPSRWESSPYLLLEALSKGRPVRVSPAGDMPAVLERAGQPESVVHEDSVQGWVRAIQAWLERPGDGTGKVELPHVEAMTRQLASLYHEACGK